MSRPSLLPPEERAELLARRRLYGVTFSELSQVTGIREGTLRVWQRRLGRPRAAGFVELEPARADLGHRSFEVELACGRRVHVPRGFDAAELARLVAALEGSC
jgi:transposase-like protein